MVFLQKKRRKKNHVTNTPQLDYYYPFDFFYSGYLVTKAGSATVALGRFLAPHIKNQSTKALSHIIEQSDEKSQKQLNIASELTTGTVTALSTVSK